jgi:hypothetical protein
LRDVINNLRMLKVSEISDETVNFLKSSTNFFDNQELYMIIARIDSASQRLNNILANADSSKFISNIEGTSSRLLQTSQELKNFADNLNSEIKGLNLPDKVQDAFGRYDSVMNNTNKVINLLGYRSENVLFGFNEAIEEIKTTNKQLRKSLKALSDNPSQLLFSEPPPKEK